LEGTFIVSSWPTVH